MITAKEALAALDVLAAQVGNARLRKLWKGPIETFIKQPAPIEKSKESITGRNARTE